MNWDAIGAIGEIVGAMAVVVTLIYLAAQVRQSTVATQAATLQNSVGNDMQVLTTVGATAEASEALYKYSFSPETLNETQLIQGRWLFASTVRHWENLYLQRLSGTLSEKAWQAREPALRARTLPWVARVHRKRARELHGRAVHGFCEGCSGDLTGRSRLVRI